MQTSSCVCYLDPRHEGCNGAMKLKKYLIKKMKLVKNAHEAAENSQYADLY